MTYLATPKDGTGPRPFSYHVDLPCPLDLPSYEVTREGQPAKAEPAPVPATIKREVYNVGGLNTIEEPNPAYLAAANRMRPASRLGEIIPSAHAGWDPSATPDDLILARREVPPALPELDAEIRTACAKYRPTHEVNSRLLISAIPRLTKAVDSIAHDPYRVTHLRRVVDVALSQGVPRDLIEQVVRMTLADLFGGEPCLYLDPCSACHADAVLEENSKERDRIAAAVHARNLAATQVPNGATCSSKGCFVVTQPHGSVRHPALESETPWRVDPVRGLQFRIAPLPGLPGEQFYGCEVERGEDVPGYCTRGEWSLPVKTSWQWSDVDANRRLGLIPKVKIQRGPRSTKGYQAGKEFMHEVLPLARQAWTLLHVRDCLANGFALEPHDCLAIEVEVRRDMARAKALSDARNSDPSAVMDGNVARGRQVEIRAEDVTPSQRAGILESYGRAALEGRVPYASMVPSVVEKIADGWKSLIAPIVSLFSDRTEATADELAQVTGASPDSQELHAAAKAAGLERRRVSGPDGRKRVWAKSA